MTIRAQIAGVVSTTEYILDGTGAIEVLEADEHGTWVDSVRVVDASGSGANVTIDRHDGTTAYQLSGAIAIAANGEYALNVGFMIDKGWSLRLTASAANRLHVTVNYLTMQS